jgi:hypothetical protein
MSASVCRFAFREARRPGVLVCRPSFGIGAFGRRMLLSFERPTVRPASLPGALLWAHGGKAYTRRAVLSSGP